jgi:hypothetical protein
MALNLVRNSRVFFTTNVDSTTGVINNSATAQATTANTVELQVLDGFTFSQNTNQDTITISEAGGAPVRGQRAFNTSLAPVDFSMSTYVRPSKPSTVVKAEESVLWNALMGVNDIDSTGVTITGSPSLAYTFTDISDTESATKGSLVITLTSGALTNTPTLKIGDTVVLGGITFTGATDKLNAAAKIVSFTTTTSGANPVTVTENTVGTTVATSNLTAITLEYADPYTASIASGITVGTLKAYKSSWAPATSTYSLVSSASSNFNQLQKFGLIFVVDSVAYAVDNAALNQATIDFGLDAIATIAWTGQATALRQITTTLSGSTFTGTDFGGTAAAKNTAANYITNKLSTVTLKLTKALKKADDTVVAAAGSEYNVALTGGSLTINNNISYITPANLGVVNSPVVYYTGTRAINGSINAYLKTGTDVNGTGKLLMNMLSAATTTIEPMITLSIAIGGSSNTTKVVLDMPSATISIPTVDVQQVVSTVINFTAQGSSISATAAKNTFDLSKSNDLTIKYYSSTTTA